MNSLPLIGGGLGRGWSHRGHKLEADFRGLIDRAATETTVCLTELCEQAPCLPGGPAHHGVPAADQN
jgi:hypothetical protein